MKEKDKNASDKLSDFLRYHGHEMTDRERNAFERGLQKDPFASEASEGFNETDSSSAEKDLAALSLWLNKKSSSNKRILLYRIAASIAVLLIVSSIFIIGDLKKPSEQLPRKSVSSDIQETPVLSAEEDRSKKKVLDYQVAAAPDQNKSVQHEILESLSVSDSKEEPAEMVINDNQNEAISITEAKNPVLVDAVDKSMTAGALVPGIRTDTTIHIRGRIISSEDNQPIPGASISVKGNNISTITDSQGYFMLHIDNKNDKRFMARFVGMQPKEFKAEKDSDLEIRLDPAPTALNETVVVGYGVKRAGEELENAPKGYTPPQPVTGKKEFDNYIQDHIRRPDSITSGQRIAVVLEFSVEVNGKIDTISVIRSPGSLFSEEAKRLVREGPAWQPAEVNGEKIRDHVRIRIVFK
jgi:hypothetical protein